MTDYVKAWQCIGCGKLDAPANCIGICEDRKVELVHASEHEAVLATLARVRAERDALAALLRRLVCTTPRPGQFEGTFHAFQDEARRALTELRDTRSVPARGSGSERPGTAQPASNTVATR
jgi:hypothetical protein